MGLCLMQRYKTLVSSYAGPLAAQVVPRFLYVSKSTGKWQSHILARSSGYFSAVLPTLRNQN